MSDPAQKLHKHWDDASKHVVHFSIKRVPDKIEDLDQINISGALFQSIVKDILLVFARFLRRMTKDAPEWTRGSWIPDAQTQPDEFNVRLVHERNKILISVFNDACERVDLDPDALLNVGHGE